jgi:hypothetical protein
MKIVLFELALLLLSSAVSSAVNETEPSADFQPQTLEGRYEGKWATTKNKVLDGPMHCRVRQLAPDRWEGRFWGTWQHADFDYTVEFTGRPEVGKPVVGKATIDGASYDWKGILTPADFTIKFTGSRYEGHMELKRVTELASAN